MLLVSSMLSLWRCYSLVNLSSSSKIYSHRKTNQLLNMCCRFLHISTHLSLSWSTAASGNPPCLLYTCKSQEQNQTINLYLTITLPAWTQYSPLVSPSQIHAVPSPRSQLLKKIKTYCTSVYSICCWFAYSRVK